jgi:CRISPR-associated protein Csx14
MREKASLIATLGGQPQIITFTLDLLLARREPIDQVIVVYLASNPRYYQAYRRLMGEFVGDRYAGRTCHLRGVAVRTQEDFPVDEAFTPTQLDAIHKTFHELIGELKKQDSQIHLSLSGGRRIMALLALEAAMRYLTPADRVWHIYTTPELTEQARDGQVMHAPVAGGTRLISVPFVPWASYFPGLAPLLSSTPLQRIESPPNWLDDAERARCRQVWDALTPRQRDALAALVKYPGRQEAAAHLSVAISTLDTHREHILNRCSETWNHTADGELDVAFLKERFGPFLRGLEEV